MILTALIFIIIMLYFIVIIFLLLLSYYYFCPGTIGLQGISSPPFFTHGRMLNARLPILQDAPFYVDNRSKKVFIDFGNSLAMSENGSFDTDLLDGLLVAMPLNENPSISCSDDLFWLGLVLYRSPGWYANSAGIQVFPPLGVLSDDEMKKLKETPLIVAEVFIFAASLIC